jgi:hypothetical protein
VPQPAQESRNSPLSSFGYEDWKGTGHPSVPNKMMLPAVRTGSSWPLPPPPCSYGRRP